MMRRNAHLDCGLMAERPGWPLVVDEESSSSLRLRDAF
jgi:hypothetical protein